MNMLLKCKNMKRKFAMAFVRVLIDGGSPIQVAGVTRSMVGTVFSAPRRALVVLRRILIVSKIVLETPGLRSDSGGGSNSERVLWIEDSDAINNSVVLAPCFTVYCTVNRSLYEQCAGKRDNAWSSQGSRDVLNQRRDRRR
jgi:hypothetical protein